MEIETQKNEGDDAKERYVQNLRSQVLSGGEVRDSHLLTHPLNHRPVQIVTEQIKEAFLAITEVIAFRQPGCCFIAKYRHGKSTAIVMIASHISEVAPNIGSHLVVAKSHDQVTERNFWGDILASMQLPLLGTAEERSDRVRKAMKAACQQAGGKQFVLLIDEGQNWGTREYTWLRDLTNQLSHEGQYTVTTIIFGDASLSEVSNEFRTNRQDLWARFLMKPRQFSGIRDLRDLAFFLSQFDSCSDYVYPAGSGICYSEFYLPKAYASGWRLKGEADHLMQAFIRGAAQVNRSFTEIGMQWVGDAVNDFLNSMMHKDGRGFSPDYSEWDSAVQTSRFQDSLI